MFIFSHLFLRGGLYYFYLVRKKKKKKEKKKRRRLWKGEGKARKAYVLPKYDTYERVGFLRFF